MPLPELQAKLGTSPDGLTQAEAAKRLVQYGPNEIEEKKDNPSSIVARRSWLG
jgi:H+-transporting ATPase